MSCCQECGEAALAEASQGVCSHHDATPGPPVTDDASRYQKDDRRCCLSCQDQPNSGRGVPDLEERKGQGNRYYRRSQS